MRYYTLVSILKKMVLSLHLMLAIGLAIMRYGTIRYKVNPHTHLHSTLRLYMPRTPRPHGVGFSSPGRIEQVLSRGFRGAIAIDIGIQRRGGDP